MAVLKRLCSLNSANILIVNIQGTIELKEMVEIVATLYDMEGVKGVGTNDPKPTLRILCSYFYKR